MPRANAAVTDTFYPDGTQGYTNEYTRNASLRMTGQITKKTQFTAFYDRVWKYLSHDGLQAGRDPVNAVHVSIPSPNYAQWQIKLTNTLTSKLLLDIGFNHYQAHRVRRYQPGVKQEYGSPEWYASASHQDTSLGTLEVAPADGETLQAPTVPRRRRLLRHRFACLKFGAGSARASKTRHGALNAALVQSTRTTCRSRSLCRTRRFDAPARSVPTSASMARTPPCIG
jgi:hypothetical protein